MSAESSPVRSSRSERSSESAGARAVVRAQYLARTASCFDMEVSQAKIVSAHRYCDHMAERNNPQADGRAGPRTSADTRRYASFSKPSGFSSCACGGADGGSTLREAPVGKLC